MTMNPTGGGIRNDRWGKGHFGASRGSRKHFGVDYLGMPDQWVVAPEAGKVIGTGLPYGDGGPWDCYIRFQGASGAIYKLFYCAPLPGIESQEVLEGQTIGQLLDVSAKYKQEDPIKSQGCDYVNAEINDGAAHPSAIQAIAVTIQVGAENHCSVQLDF